MLESTTWSVGEKGVEQQAKCQWQSYHPSTDVTSDSIATAVSRPQRKMENCRE